ncbi:MAG: HigA family addiction module antidote protein [Endomicrobium sp.]|jgi:addiction module HigA family antidote|uniref:HigA family addiction module antitoxin n=1 Tax=Candidatus Endomicrobiellum cubanum TaxID=3242325 RepID=UPI002832431D|nr:HigA family addiction module antidote protein [Endomicrobium sp.]
MEIKMIEPREILIEEFMRPFKITAYRLAKETKMPMTRIAASIKGKRKITANTALKLPRYFGNSPDFWIGIQTEYDLRTAKIN